MAGLNFKRRFVGAILNGEKRQTIRKPRNKPVRIGDRLHLLTGMRTKSCRKLGVASCTALQDITIERDGFTLDGVRADAPGRLAEMARADGFASWREMADFFQETHGLPFNGVLVRWGKLEPAGDPAPPRSRSPRPRASISPMDPNPARSTMNRKPVLWRENTQTVLKLDAEEFGHKRLCDGITFSPADTCAYDCAFCYVEGQARKFTKEPREAYAAKMKLAAPPAPHEVVIRRRNALGVLKQQLFDEAEQPRFPSPSDTRVVFTSPLTDVGANAEFLSETAAAIKLIMEATHWHVRVLSKSDRLPDLVGMIPTQYRGRLIMGVSTGTLDENIAKAIEKAPLVSKRIKSLHQMQDGGIRTFGMICPSLPQDDYDKFSREICEAIRADKCEHVWAEVINLRGESFTRTRNALKAADCEKEAQMLSRVCGPGASERWEQYARATFLAHAKNIPPQKLRFLQYVKRDTIDWWRQQKTNGAVLLGEVAHPKPATMQRPSLTAEQKTMRQTLEAAVTRGVKATFEMWLALHRIRTYENGLLYRSRGFETFQAYCLDKWGYAKAHAHRLANCGGFIETLQAFKSPNGDSLPLPRSEGQIRPILALPEDRRVEGWAHALEVAPPEQLTGQIVAKSVREFSEKQVPRGLSPRARAIRALTALRAAVEGLPKAEEIGRRLDGIEGLI